MHTDIENPLFRGKEIQPGRPGAPHKATRKWARVGAASVAALTVPGLLLVTTGAAGAATSTANAKIAAYAITMQGAPYVWGGTSPRGFDCSGLSQYVYKHAASIGIPRTADAQSHWFRQESKARAKPGDLVFFHATTNLASHVYHVGIYEGGTTMVAASSSRHSVVRESFTWAGNTVTFGTITHS